MASNGTSSAAAPTSSPLPSAVRLARLSDLPRISLVAAASFFYSPIFQYTRPHCDAYPLHAFPMDTIATERLQFLEAILDPKRAVLVVEAAFDPDESIRVCRGLRREYPKLDDDHYPKKPAGRTGVVGVASFSFPQGCKRVGEFMPEESCTGGLANARPPRSQKRDECSDGKKRYKYATEVAKQQWLKDCIKVSIAVHPAYWRHGHAKKLMQWILDLADEDNMAVGVCAAATGKKLFENTGFTAVQEVVVAGYKEHPDSITAWIGVRQPVGGRKGSEQEKNGRRNGEGGYGDGSGKGEEEGVWEDCRKRKSRG